MKQRTQNYIWLPPRTSGEKSFLNDVSLIVMVVAGDSARYFRSSIDALEGIKQAVLILDARDVTLLRAPLPALQGAKLAKALPNAVEDLLLQDVNACALVVGPKLVDSADSVVGVIDRSWLELVLGAIERRGISVRSAVPAQLVLPLGEGMDWAVACYHNGVAVRTDALSGFGWGASDDSSFRQEAIGSALLAARQSTGASNPVVSVYLENDDWQAPATDVLQRGKLRSELGSLPTPEISDTTLDFLDARLGTKGGRFLGTFNWKAWKIPALTLASATACFLVGLNLHWAQLAQEKSRIKVEAERRFRQAFPQTQVVVDPLLQMQRNVSTLRVQAGQAGPDDFVPLASKLASALATVPPLQGNTGGPARVAESIQSLEYRGSKLKVRFVGGVADSRNNREQIQSAASRFGLKFEFDPDGSLSVGAQL